MNSLIRFIFKIRRSRRAARQVLRKGAHEDDKRDKQDLTLTREQAERLKQGTMALFTSSIHP